MKLQVGRVSRAHGLRGEVVVEAITDRTERFVVGACFDSDRGPLEVQACRPFQHRWLVTFAGCTTREQAEALRGVVLLAEAIDDPDDVFVHQLVGRHVVDQHGIDRGAVVAVEANPAADLLVLEDKALVPMNFVVDIGDAIAVDVPAGLFE